MNGVSVEEKTVGNIFKGGERYVVPLYQREYAWTDREVGRLLSDIWESYKKDSSRNYYMGTLVVKPVDGKDGKYQEVIDGQQRLTTLSILFSLISDGTVGQPVLRFDNREEANCALGWFYKTMGENRKQLMEPKLSKQEPKDIPLAMRAALSCIKGFRPSLDDGNVSSQPLFDDGLRDADLREYILNKVKLFRVCMPDVDAMSYFEVMNNRGEQLEYHELLKEILVARVRDVAGAEEVGKRSYDELAEIFDRIWTACSHMDGNLLDHMHACFELQNPDAHWWNLKLESIRVYEREDEVAPPWERQSVIRDFSNFLMHVLRLYVKKLGLAVNVPLDERRMQDKFEDPAIRLNPVEFLDLLVKTRLDFDKYIVKAKVVNDEVEKWRLKEVVRYKGKSVTYDAKNTYPDVDKVRKIICLQSALQVSNAEQRYKEWVYTVLEASNEDRANPDRIVSILEDFVRTRICAAKDQLEQEGFNIFSCGLRTPRLFLNIVDYLIWCENQSEFVFKYYNSIEHHHPQHDDREAVQWEHPEIDEIGNLYLTSSSDNSSMSNTPAIGKVSLYRNNHGQQLPGNPKRRFMYECTTAEGGWSKQKMQMLTERVKTLMNGFLSAEA